MVTILRRHKIILFPTALIVIALLYVIAQYRYQLQNTLSYATRPLWDVADGPKNVITHYYAEGMNMDAHACQLHNWPVRAGSSRDVRVVDSILMSSELDLLEIRLNTLDSVVDQFFIIESNATFTGLPKETYFADNRARFAKFESKIVYKFLPGSSLKEGEDAWTIERNTRNAMTYLLRQHITVDSNTLVLMSDVDEIPSAHSLALLKACDFGSSIHLHLKEFLYSFEWSLGTNSWRASVHLWGPSTYYRHSKSSDTVLADSGWHCSYCFRTIPEYVVKMKGFSHSDRIGGNMKLLDPSRIQTTICKGKDIFGMLPEAYSWVDMLSQMSLEPLTTAVGLPRFLIDNAERFKFLLPGGCLRAS